jgi:hypothetical protein
MMAVVMMVQQCDNSGEGHGNDDYDDNDDADKQYKHQQPSQIHDYDDNDDADKQYKHQQPSQIHLFKRVAFANLPQFRFLQNRIYKRNTEAIFIMMATRHLRFLGSMSAPSCPRFR